MHHIFLDIILVFSNIYIAGMFDSVSDSQHSFLRSEQPTKSSCLLFTFAAGYVEMRIVNGQEADIRQIPYQVQLLYFNQLFCGGSIVTKRHVISAGHCFP